MDGSTAEEVAEIAADATLPVCRPFVKWVGGKRQLLPEILRRIPKTIDRYYEPFVGGGAVFFALRPRAAYIADLNPDLINAYRVVQSDVEALIDDLAQHRYAKEHYYKVRDADRAADFEQRPAVSRASRLIYLNKSCYNGLYRVNSKGHFNTPFGRYTNPTIVDAENLRACSSALQCAAIERAEFAQIEALVTPQDFVYFDPPYVPLSATAYFTGYQRGGFDLAMQRNLFDLCCRLDSRGVRFLLSNSSAPFVIELYRKFKIEIVSATRMVNSRAAKRGALAEVLVSNY